MKCWLIKLENCGYDEYDAFVVVAKTKERAWEIIRSKYGDGFASDNINKDNIKSITEVDYTKENVVLDSFNAG